MFDNRSDASLIDITNGAKEKGANFVKRTTNRSIKPSSSPLKMEDMKETSTVRKEGNLKGIKVFTASMRSPETDI